MRTVAALSERFQALRAGVRQRAHRWRWDARVVAREKLGLPPPEPLARVMFALAQARTDAFVVQVGSHDASQLDPINRYIRTRGWRGILVEPVPTVFERLRENYAGIEGLVLENVAIAERSGSMELYYIPQTADKGLPRWYDALASFKKDVLLGHANFIPDIAHRIESMEVPSLTFADLCERHGVDRVDVIQVDTEGYDLEILRQIDLDRFQPALVQLEELHLDRSARAEARSIFSRSGYQVIGNGMDCMGLAPSRLRPGEESVLAEWTAAVTALSERERGAT